MLLTLHSTGSDPSSIYSLFKKLLFPLHLRIQFFPAFMLSNFLVQTLQYLKKKNMKTTLESN